MQPLLLGLDIGTTNCKAVVFTPAGETVALGRAPTPTQTPAPGRAEYAPDQLWATIVAVIRQALGGLAERGGSAADIAALAVAGMGEAGVFLDRRDQPCSPMLSWYDSRALDENRWLSEVYGGRRVFAITGLTPQPNFTLAKLLWFKRHLPQAIDQAAAWLHLPDWTAFHLTGAKATDTSLAARTMLYDLTAGQWSRELLDLCGVRPDVMPPIVPSGTVIGHVTPAAAAETGLAPGTPVAAGGHDHLVGAFGVGVTHPGQVLNSMGTAETMLMVLDRPPLTDAMYAARVHLGAHTAPGVFYTIGGLPAAGATLEWARALFVPDQTSAPGYARLNDLALGVAPGSLGALFLAHLRGAGPPHSDPRSRGAFVGLTVDTTPAHMARAVFEGMAYVWRTALENIRRTTGAPIERITVIGGGARNRAWVQIKADVVGQPLHVLDVEEAVAWGAAALAGYGVGLFGAPDDVVARASFGAREISPTPENIALYNHLFREVYTPLYPTLKATSYALSATPDG